MDILAWRLFFILVACTCWFTYVIYRSKQQPGILTYWGLRIQTFSKVVRMLLPYGLSAVGIFIVVGYFKNTLHITWHIIPILLIYPIWGTVQQFLVIALFGGNLYDLKNFKIKKSFIIILTALLFGLVHYPDIWLVFGTFILALLYGSIYLKIRNVYAMGLFHGWLGGIFYYTVVNRDPFQEVFEKILH